MHSQDCAATRGSNTIGLVDVILLLVPKSFKLNQGAIRGKIVNNLLPLVAIWLVLGQIR